MPADPRTLLFTQRKYSLKPIDSGYYYHFGIIQKIRDAFTAAAESPESNVIYLQINIDGLPLFKSTKEQFWPILARINQLNVNTPFIVGMYCGNNKPESIEDYLFHFIEEMTLLQTSGITFDKILYEVKISCFICGTPARSFIKRTKGHNAYYGCDKCVQRGVWKDKVIFPETNAILRTDENFKEMIDPHYGPMTTPLSQLHIGLVTQFVLDPMHLVYLGVTRKLIRLWMKGSHQLKCHLSSVYINAISQSLLSFHNFLPREFGQKCRSFNEIERWKATEYRQFTLYSGIVALKKKHSQITL